MRCGVRLQYIRSGRVGLAAPPIQDAPVREHEGQVKGIAQLRTMPEGSGQPSTLVRPVANLKLKVDNFKLPRDGLYEIAFFHNDQPLQTIQIEAVVQRPGFVQ